MSVDAVKAAAAVYCESLNKADGDALDALIHDNFVMTWIRDSQGAAKFLDKAKFVGGIRTLSPENRAPSYEILSVDLEGDNIAQVKLWVDLGDRRFVDFLGFFRVDGDWKLITKLFRVADGPEM